MDIYQNKIYISYAWRGESEELVDKIDHSLQARGITIIRDKRDLGFKGSIQEFMEEIGRSSGVIVVVSNKYLRSQNCMFELVEIAANKQLRDRIFPIVLSDANIYDPIKRLEYVKYWEDKRQELADAIRTVDPANLQGIRDDMDNYHRFRAEVSILTSTLKDMNTLTPEIHQDTDFSALYEAIEKHFQGAESKDFSIPISKMGTLSDDVLLDKVNRLPSALFERLVFKFDKNNSVPGRESAQSIRSIELLRLVGNQENGINSLWNEVQKLIGG